MTTHASLRKRSAGNSPEEDFAQTPQGRETEKTPRHRQKAASKVATSKITTGDVAAGEKDVPVRDYVLTDQIGHLLRRAHQRATAIFLSNMANASLTPTQFAALVMIRDEGPVSQNHLGRMIAMDPATTQGVISRLHERALIERVPDETDRRRMALTLSARGQALTDGLIDVAQEISAQTLAPLSAAESKSLLSALKKIG